MDTLLLLLLSLAVGTAGGLLLYRLKVPGGMIVGAMAAVALLNILTEKAYLPPLARTLTQILAGGYVACTVSRDDIRHFPKLIKPYLLVMLSYLILNLLCGLLIWKVTPHVSLFTALMCCVPGGMTDIPIIAADMGADVTKVAALQFIRMAVGLSLFPAVISLFIKRQAGGAAAPVKKERKKGTWQQLGITLAIAAAFGFLGKKTGIPAGTMLFSVVSVLVYKMLGGTAYVSIKLRRVAQILTGVYIGTCFTRQNVAELLDMWPAALLLLAGFSLNCIVMGFITSRLTSLNRAEAMLVSTPAGASDMALVSADMGVTNPEVAVLHVLRLITVVTIFPHIIALFARLIAGAA